MAGVQRIKVTVAFPRTIPKATLLKVNSYARRVGRLLWAWNRMHAAFADMFAAFIDRNQMAVGRAVWHAVKADTAQRDMLKDLLPLQTTLRPEVSEGIEWLIAVAGKLSQHRNDVAHTPMSHDRQQTVFKIIPDSDAGDPPRVQRLSRADLQAFHRKLTGDLVALSYYARYLASETYDPMQLWTSPERPLLRSLPRSEIPQTRSQKRRRAKKQQLRLRRQSSRQMAKPHP